MSAIVVNAAVKEQLLAAGDVFEFRDEAGALIVRTRKVPDWPPTPPPGWGEIDGEWPSEEEAFRIDPNGKRYTPEQVMERLRELTK